MSAYARHRGIDESAVRKAVRQGRITLVEGKIDPKAADKEWARNSLKPVGQGAHAGRRRPRGRLDGARGRSEAGPKSYAAARARREQALAELAEQELARKKARLIDAEEARQSVFKAARVARDMVLGLPDRVAPRLVGQDEVEIYRILAEETQRICDTIAKAPAALIAETDTPRT